MNLIFYSPELDVFVVHVGINYNGERRSHMWMHGDPLDIDTVLENYDWHFIGYL